MIEPSFRIELTNLHWLVNVNSKDDLCAHGNVYVKVDDEEISTFDSLEVTVSSTALYLMRTLERDYTAGDFASQLLPCCGHFFMPGEGNNQVEIMGCGNGINWNIMHLEDGAVKHTSENGNFAIIGFQEYKDIVLNFADTVKGFYDNGLQKNIPNDEYDKNGYLAFWNEWHTLRKKWN